MLKSISIYYELILFLNEWMLKSISISGC